MSTSHKQPRHMSFREIHVELDEISEAHPNIVFTFGPFRAILKRQKASRFFQFVAGDEPVSLSTLDLYNLLHSARREAQRCQLNTLSMSSESQPSNPIPMPIRSAS